MGLLGIIVFDRYLESKNLRTKHYMADSQYTYNLVYFPCAVARVRLPLGLPAGRLVLGALIKQSDLSKSITKQRHYFLVPGFFEPGNAST